MNEVMILLATYNGEKYLEVMIESILAQDSDKWQLIISDDGSTDDTVKIIEEYAEQYPAQIKHYRSGIKFGGAKKHFMHLLEVFQDAEYIMFADQDDRWHKDKVSKTLQLMKEIERDKEISVMVHTDLCVVDEKLNCINPSFMKFSNLDGERMRLNTLLIQNVVTGCTMMINRSLAKLVSEKVVVKEILMHDWWIALIAATCGRVAFLNEATIDYRQHGDNTVGAKNSHSAKYIVDRLLSGENHRAIRNTFFQANALLSEYAHKMKSEDAKMVSCYAKLKDANFMKRRWIYLRYGIFKRGISRKVGQFLYG